MQFIYAFFLIPNYFVNILLNQNIVLYSGGKEHLCDAVDCLGQFGYASVLFAVCVIFM